MAVDSAAELEPVVNVTARLRALLDQGGNLKPRHSVEPPLPTSELIEGVDSLHDDFTEGSDQNYKYATVENAARELFYSVISSTEIIDPALCARVSPCLDRSSHHQESGNPSGEVFANMVMKALARYATAMALHMYRGRWNGRGHR